jgi:hypothetical protein
MSAPFWEIATGGLHHLYPEAYLGTPGDFDPSGPWIDSKEIDKEYRPVTVRFGRTARIYPDFLQIGMMTIVSEKFRKVLVEMNGNDMKFLPVTILGKDGEAVDRNPYWYARVAERLDCIDYANSDLEFWNPGTRLVKKVRRLVINDAAVGDHHLFHPLGLPMLLVSNELKRRLEQDKLSVSTRSVESIRLGV